MDLNNASIVTTIAVTDLNRSKKFYGGTLGLREIGSIMPNGDDIVFASGENHFVCVYQRPSPSGSTATVCEFDVDDVAGTVKTLKDKGVDFEEYDMPEMGIKTKNGVATMGEAQSAWFKDPDGNILAVGNGLKILQDKGLTVSGHA